MSLTALQSCILEGMDAHYDVGGVSAVFTDVSSGSVAAITVIDSGGRADVLTNDAEIMSVERLIHAKVSDFPAVPTINDTVVIDGTTYYIIHRKRLHSQSYELGLSTSQAHGHG